jgi:hypothetical protein
MFQSIRDGFRVLSLSCSRLDSTWIETWMTRRWDAMSVMCTRGQLEIFFFRRSVVYDFIQVCMSSCGRIGRSIVR